MVSIAAKLGGLFFIASRNAPKLFQLPRLLRKMLLQETLNFLPMLLSVSHDCLIHTVIGLLTQSPV